VRILIFHGYLLRGTGSNIYNASLCRALAGMGRCGAPCTGDQSVKDYAVIVDRAAEMIAGDSREVVGALRQRMSSLSSQERYEDAGAVRDRLLHLVRATARAQRIAPMANSAEIMAARPRSQGGWEVICVRFGRLAGTAVTPRGADPRPYFEALAASAENVTPSPGPAPSASAEETEKVLRWLESTGVRMVAIDGEWTCPVHGAGAARDNLDPDHTAYSEVVRYNELVSCDEPSDPGLRHRPPAAVLVVPVTPGGPKALVAPTTA
jgi:DNA polymerase-3 subunit epsilon